ncbi:MAG: cysteine desulfuration protein SufE [Wigglesworthia glossinidia]|nr:cysteine desulfuration protein SufE [Wigglesworthia glossinidia]
MNKHEFIKNFSYLHNWQEKYLYLIELGKSLSPFPEKFKNSNHLVTGCQNLVWIALLLNRGQIKFYGESNSVIVKGLIAVLFILYKNLKVSELVLYDINSYLKRLSLTDHLTPSRMQGLGAIINFIKKSAFFLQKN